MVWIYILIAAFTEVCWSTSLKYLSFANIKSSFIADGLLSSNFFMQLLPLLGYIVFGLASVYLISLAFKEIPVSMALSSWMGLALILQTLVDIFWFRVSFQPIQFVFIGLIIIGVFGTRYFSKSVA
ncbi:MAG: SMR family transporter [Chitinophagales bacterium]|jgi:multidrug transporter EmrE-like cation transporter|nr:SMR family transporter [Chitinophagales bacterium]